MLWVIECNIVNLTVTSWTLLFRWNTGSEHAASSHSHVAVSVIADCTPGQARPRIAHVHPPSLINEQNINSKFVSSSTSQNMLQDFSGDKIQCSYVWLLYDMLITAGVD